MGAHRKHTAQDIYMASTTKSRFMTWPSRWIALALTALLALKFYQLSPSLLQEFDVALAVPFPIFTRNKCTPPSPNLFAVFPPQSDDKLIEKASKDTNDYLRKRVSKHDIDSISVGVVTPGGLVFEGGYGVLKANETDKDATHPVNRHSIYRIASVTKMFAVLETLILRQKGVLNWDDPVEKYLPDIKPFTGGWADLLAGDIDNLVGAEEPLITLRQLATHLSGIGRDYPPSPYPNWPLPLNDKLQFHWPNYSEIVESVAGVPLVNNPYHYPIYSNTGMGLLGLANVAANSRAHSNSSLEPKTHRDLVQRDIFDPLGLSHSFYRVPNNSLRDLIAVPRSEIGISYADQVFPDAIEAAGAQYSSLNDLAKLTQMILSPGDTTLLSRNTIREWLRPIHNWNLATGQLVGAPWEITTFEDAQIYSKGGDLPSYHTQFSLVPEHSYGVIVLTTGSHTDTSRMANEIIKRFHRAFKDIKDHQLKERYGGKWTNGDDFFEISIRKGAPYIQKGVIFGRNILDKIAGNGGDSQNGKTGPSALWTTGRTDEFRIALDRPQSYNKPGVGCMPYWATIDGGLSSRGAPVDLVYWRDGLLHYPSAGLTFSRHS